MELQLSQRVPPAATLTDLNANQTWCGAPGNVSEKLLECDLLVTDYSSIVYEAFLLDIPTLFYIPDIEAYRLSPGLNIDPLTRVPDLCALDEQSLATRITDFANAEGKPGAQALDSFMESYFDIGEPRDGSAAQRFVERRAWRRCAISARPISGVMSSGSSGRSNVTRAASGRRGVTRRWSAASFGGTRNDLSFAEKSAYAVWSMVAVG